MNCWMGDEKVPLPDLNTQDAQVQATYGDWIENLVHEYSLDGLRIDGMCLASICHTSISTFFQLQNM